MAVENEEIEVQEVDSAAAEAAFAEQFGELPVDNTDNEQTDTEVQELQPDTEETADEAAEVIAADETPEQQVEDEHAKLLALLNDIPARIDLTEKEIRQIHGKFGEINQKLQKLQELNNSNSGAANVRVTKDQFKRLNEEFPEIAEMLAEDLAGISLPSSGGVNAESIQPFVNTEVAKVREELNRTMNTNLLTIQHRDWTTVYGSEDFSTWKANQTPEVQHELDNSWDAMYLGEQLTKFKTWRDTVKNTKEKNNKRLLDAVLPKGGNKAPNGLVSEEDAFNAQFK
jgi:Asp-tRNA(Asn)/Glu-tRNA(Gln) amidotransferase C subunit